MKKIIAGILLASLSSQVMADCQPVGITTDGQQLYTCTNTVQQPVQVIQQPVQNQSDRMLEGVIIGAIGGAVLSNLGGHDRYTTYNYGYPVRGWVGPSYHHYPRR